MALPHIRGDLHPIRRGAMMMMICTFELLRESERDSWGRGGEGGGRESTRLGMCAMCVHRCVIHIHVHCA
jgi:hypothetical protein